MIAQFLSGAVMLAAAGVALFFVRSWRRTQERLFLLFGMGFGLLSVERWVLALVPPAHEMRPLIYLIRLAAFLLILAGVVDKNRRRR